jgi:hypothetical protein
MDNEQQRKYWFFGSKLNTVLLLVLIILMAIALLWMYQDKGRYIPINNNKTQGMHSEQTFSFLREKVSGLTAPNWTLKIEECLYGEKLVYMTSSPGMFGGGTSVYNSEGVLLCTPGGSSRLYKTLKEKECINKINYLYKNNACTTIYEKSQSDGENKVIVNTFDL